MLTPDCVKVATLGDCRFRSPLMDKRAVHFFPDDTGVRYRVEVIPGETPEGEDILFQKAGPRERVFFQPGRARAAIVTCGGLCPGLNNVIRSLVLEMVHHYEVEDILGIQYGYQGFGAEAAEPPIRLCQEFVKSIHYKGGTVLGTSRGPEAPADIVDYLERMAIDILFTVGGDGTMRGAHDIYEEIKKRNLKIAIVGIPKTIDNDIRYVYRSFGFSTALERAKDVITCASIEAEGAINGVGLVKVMGRDAGFIAAGATIASQEVNVTLIPEVPFCLEGEKGLLSHLKRRLLDRGHAVIVVAEGAGISLLKPDAVERDASGNVIYPDIGLYLKDRICAYFKEQNVPMHMKYFDPSYTIRSVPANGEDSLLCDQLARYAVHAAMAGKTDLLIGLWHNVFVHIPIPIAIGEKKQVSPESALWRAVLESTGQPRFEEPGNQAIGQLGN